MPSATNNNHPAATSAANGNHPAATSAAASSPATNWLAIAAHAFLTLLAAILIYIVTRPTRPIAVLDAVTLAAAAVVKLPAEHGVFYSNFLILYTLLIVFGTSDWKTPDQPLVLDWVTSGYTIAVAALRAALAILAFTVACHVRNESRDVGLPGVILLRMSRWIEWLKSVRGHLNLVRHFNIFPYFFLITLKAKQ
ncbi:hypothetical protein B0H17DRAFT_398029 [Mycena rosella]|uniref:Uncharacterized protein n=1 Tax=Mycena rosella TaxID=1033263 RepID=A0AAD7DQ05_MYCRO|nr:hypothetical protein B0H17DRAFT_398029 [Mycena rosella]